MTTEAPPAAQPTPAGRTGGPVDREAMKNDEQTAVADDYPWAEESDHAQAAGPSTTERM